MARFMVKASEYKNVCKAVNDRKLAELKKEIIEILKKQDEKEFKKAIDYLNSQELYYTHLEKSIMTGKWVEKAGYGIGTVRTWKGKKYKKVAQGKWVRVFDKEGRGTNVAIGKLISKIQKCDNVEDLMVLVMANKSRFVDENGVDLPILDKLRAAADIRNEKLSGESSSYTYGVGENTSREKNEIFAGKDKITKEEAELHKVARKFSQMPTGELNKRKAQLERWIDNKTKSKRDHLNNTIWREKYQEELDAINKELDKRTEKPSEKEEITKEKEWFDKDEVEKFSEIMESEKPSLERLQIMKQRQEIALKNAKEEEPSDGSKGRARIAEEKLKIINQKINEEEKKEKNIETFTADDFKNVSREKLYDMIGLKYHQNVKYKNEIWTVDAIAATGHEDGKFQLALLQHYPNGEIKNLKYITSLDIDKVSAIEEQEEPADKEDYKIAQSGKFATQKQVDYATEVADKYSLTREEMLKKPITTIQKYANSTVKDFDGGIDKFIEYMADGRSEGVSLDEVGKEFGKLINHNIARKIWADYESGALEVNDDGIFEPKKETKEKPDFDVEAYKKSKKKLEDTIADIDKKIQLYDSNPTPNGLKMAQQLENQKKEWQKQLENLEAQKKDYKKSVLGESLLLEGIEEQKEDEEEFLLDNILEEDIDDMAKEKEEESLFNDYTAEQPGLFNSTAMKVREAMNRCNIL